MLDFQNKFIDGKYKNNKECLLLTKEKATRNIFLSVSVAVVLVIMCIMITASSTNVSAASGDSSSAVKSLEDQISNNLANQKEIENKLYNTKSSLSSEKQTKAYIDSRINLLVQNIEDTLSLTELYSQQIAEKEVEIADKQAEINGQYAKIKDYMRISYQNGNVNYVEMILSSGSLAELFTNVERVGNMLAYQEKMMKNLNDNIIELNEIKRSLEDDKAKNEQQMASLEGQKADLESLSAESASYMQKLEKDEDAYSALQAQYKKEEAELNAELEKTLAELAKQQATSYVGGELMWPVDLKWARISSPYGNRLLNGTWEFHLGIDIPANYGENVYAANDGVIIKAQWHSSYGNYVIVDHGGGLTTLYAHNSQILVSVGDSVSKGDVIAKVGSTGNSYGNHCHFEVRQDGKTQQPLNYVVQP